MNLTCWGLGLLPYLDQTNIATKYNYSEGIFHPDNRPLIGQALSVFNCPSSPVPKVIHRTIDESLVNYADVTAGEVVSFGISEYACSAQEQHDASGSGNGILPYNGRIFTRIADVTDGLSNTFLVVEQPGGIDVYGGSKTVVGTSIWPHSRIWVGQHRLALRGTNREGVGSFSGNCVVNCTSGGGNLYSFHAGGAHVLMGDGSCRFISENLDVTTVVRLVDRADGQPVGEF